ncbi:glutamyl-tRNA synthetase [Endogone sp. FLAS-F59071]|nr:glutamyl-tRNA synthetase [Endogone sp. FLAS-F59071]|eukprot:RUS22119.1 glutamyl-tRNA synthetase [Endogone sp. FLAS-F59071]
MLLIRRRPLQVSHRSFLTKPPRPLVRHSHYQSHAHVDPTGPVRVRFAPSPTGYLHLGGLRTALFNYLLAKKTGGTFILRIEDTDRVGYFLTSLTNCLVGLGLRYRNSHCINGRILAVTIYWGSDREDNFGAVVVWHRLSGSASDQPTHPSVFNQNGSAYRCFCTAQRLQHVREMAQKAGRGPMYDRRCLSLSQRDIEENLRQGMPYTVRLLIPDGITHVHDLVYGHVEFSNTGLDDSILMKSDGFPTYHMAHVVDDHLMNITHVLRGEEWLPSTPKHILLYRAFSWTVPSFVHLPLLLNADRSKLSKRSGDVHVEDYIQHGYLPEALVNFVALLGWSPREEGKEIMGMEELVEEFSLPGLNKSNPIVSTNKLNWINKHHLGKRAGSTEGMRSLVEMLKPMVKEQYGESLRDSGNEAHMEDVYLANVISTLKLAYSRIFPTDRIHNIADIPILCGYYFVEPDYVSAESVELKAEVGDHALSEYRRSHVC